MSVDVDEQYTAHAPGDWLWPDVVDAEAYLGLMRSIHRLWGDSQVMLPGHYPSPQGVIWENTSGTLTNSTSDAGAQVGDSLEYWEGLITLDRWLISGGARVYPLTFEAYLERAEVVFTVTRLDTGATVTTHTLTQASTTPQWVSSTLTLTAAQARSGADALELLVTAQARSTTGGLVGRMHQFHVLEQRIGAPDGALLPDGT